MISLRACFLSILTFFPLLLSSSAVAEEQLFAIHGSNTVGAKLAPALAEAYLLSEGAERVSIYSESGKNESRVTGYFPEQDRVASIYIAAHGSSSGFTALQTGEADIAAASRPIKKSEQAKLSQLGNFNNQKSEHVVGIDGLAIIVHPDNPLNRLDIKDIARLFSGEIRNWQQLGGNNFPVELFARDDHSGTWDTFKSLVLAKNYKLSDRALRFESNSEVSRRITKTPGAIGFVSLNTIAAAKPLMISSGTRALEPVVHNVATEDYLLSRRLFMYLPEVTNNRYAEEFLEFVRGAEAQKVVSEVGYVSQNVKLMPVDIESAPESYKKLVSDYERASVNFRFSMGRAKLDNKAKADIERLAGFIEKNPSEIRLLGFAEQSSGASNSDLLAKLRADVVRRALIKAGVPRKWIDHTGYGQYMALSSEESMISKVRNRRVEVWIKKG